MVEYYTAALERGGRTCAALARAVSSFLQRYRSSVLLLQGAHDNALVGWSFVIFFFFNKLPF